VRWLDGEERLNLEWRESGGPVVGPPAHRGFGTRLLSGALDQFDGKIGISFEATGLVCKMSVKLSPTFPSIIPEKDREGAQALSHS
jgi:two-component sensor histidine kinase